LLYICILKIQSGHNPLNPSAVTPITGSYVQSHCVKSDAKAYNGYIVGQVDDFIVVARSVRLTEGLHVEKCDIQPEIDLRDDYAKGLKNKTENQTLERSFKK
jgi:hypothetical protein